MNLDPSNPFCMFEASVVCATCTNHLLQGKSYSLDTIIDETANVNLYHVLESQFQFKCKLSGQSKLCRQCFSKTLLLYDFHEQCTESAKLFNKYVEYQEQLTTLNDTDLYMSDTHANSIDVDEEQDQKLTIEEEVIYTRDDSTMVKTEDECKFLDKAESFDNMSCNNIASDCQIIPPVSESLKCNKTMPDTRQSSRPTEKETNNYKGYTGSQNQDHMNQYIIDNELNNTNNVTFHKVIHKKRYACSYCGKATASLFKLKIHERYHTGERPYECRQCGKGYISNDTLQRHLETHSKIRFKCEICKKMLKSKASLNNHKHLHMGIRYECSKCSKSFPQKFLLNRHLRKHVEND